MANYTNRDARLEATARKFEEMKRENPPREVSCRGCRKPEREVAVLIEMSGFLFCDQCIELAARAVEVRKGGRHATSSPVSFLATTPMERHLD